MNQCSIIGTITHRIHGAAIYGNMDPIHIPQMLAYIPYMDPMGNGMFTIYQLVFIEFRIQRYFNIHLRLVGPISWYLCWVRPGSPWARPSG